MLNAYKTKHAKSVIQYSILNDEGLILDSDDVLFSKIKNKNITEIHPFFESIIPLLTVDNKEYIFSCIHLSYNNKTCITDIILNTFTNGESPLLIIHDLTTHYNNYQTTAQVRNESVIRTQVLGLKNNYLKETEEFKNKFIANFSHELRDPLTGIMTFTDILSKTDLSIEQKDYLNVLKSSSTFLKQMIDDILDLSRIEIGKLELTLSPFNIKKLLEELKAQYKIKAEEKGLQFNCIIDEDIPEIVSGDRLRLQQVLNNLLENALKFTEKGSITFNASLNQLRAQKASIHFEITDTGIGIKKEDQEHIFDSFYQVKQNSSNKGSGLGLSIVKYLVELTKSKISVTSEFGKGSTFSTNINFISKPGLKLDKKQKKISKTLDPNKKYNILLVEDSEITQLSVLKILVTQGQFFLDIVTTEEDVISRVTNLDQEVDLVLLDMKLKDTNGIDIAKAIRSLPERHQKKTPIIALTARVFTEDLKLYKKAKINDIIKKPFDQHSLLETIKKHLK
jgi:signal transduction histidine kinase/ActR/RegA family two-component response regulator